MKEVSIKFKEWADALPKCLSYGGGCDGDLGLDHEPNCPLYGKDFATLKDAFEAGYNAAKSGSKFTTTYGTLV